MDFLLRASALCGELLKLLPAGRVPAEPACCARLPVGGPGSSTLITSAPRSARIIVQKGPGASLVRSSTFIPLSGGLAMIVLLRSDQSLHPSEDFHSRASRFRQLLNRLGAARKRNARFATLIARPDYW